MASFSKSSLNFSDTGDDEDKLDSTERPNFRLKRFPTRISKQNLSEHRMFGSNRKSILIGKKFKKVGKGIMHGSVKSSMTKQKGISPSLEEFDKMMSKVTGKTGLKKSMFNKKQP